MRRRAIIGAAALPLAALAAALALGGGAGGDGEGSAAAADGASATVERRTLAERLTSTGTIGYAGESTVVGRLSGTVTWLPAAGDTVRRGERLYEVEGEPVLLMYGAVPAYRELAEGVEDGADVEQLERNLAALGYEPGTVDEEFTYLTAGAVSAWQEDLGLEATGAVELGRVAFLPGARRVTGVDATLGESIGGAPTGAERGAGSTAMVAYREPSLGEADPAAGAEDEAETPAEESPPPAQEPQTGPAGKEPREPQGGEPQGTEPQGAGPRTAPPQTAAPKTASPSAATGTGEAPSEGAAEAPSVAVLQTTSTARVVSVELEPDQQSMARRGQEVEVVLPGGRSARGEVRRLEAVESEAEEGAPGGGEAEPGVEVTVALTDGRRVPALDGATVSVVFTRGVREDVLAVPLTALLATGGERFAVVVEEGAARRQVEVEPGLAADGYVEVSGEGLREGMRVEVAE